MEGHNLKLKDIIDEALDLKTIMMQTQQLEQLDKTNAGIANQLKNNPDLAKQFQSFQSLVQQQLQQKKLEAQQAQQVANVAQQTQQQNQQNQKITTAANGTPVVNNQTTAGATANQ